MRRRTSAIVLGLASVYRNFTTTGIYKSVFSPASYTSGSDVSSSDTPKVYLPWNARPWEMTYLHYAAEIDYLDDNIRSILCCKDRKALFKLLQTTSKIKDIEEYLEDPVTKGSAVDEELQYQRAVEEPTQKEIMSTSKRKCLNTGKKSAKVSQKRKEPATYIQVV